MTGQRTTTLAPAQRLKMSSMDKFKSWRGAYLVFVLCAATVTAMALPAETKVTIEIQFTGTDGANPYAPLVQGTDGSLFGTTAYGGDEAAGTVFKLTDGYKLTTLYSFCSQTNCADGEIPQMGLMQATNGHFYGTTYQGDVNNGGTVFEITAGGKLTTLYSFDETDGHHPDAGLVQATNGNFYGTTYQGGVNNGGTVFEITAGGKLTTLYNFCAQASCADGEYPQAALVQATNGHFYGTTYQGGTNNAGTVFEITAGGKLTTLYNFCAQASCVDGEYPQAALVQATNGHFYGTTYQGGTNNYGTVFEITAAGKLTTLYSFCAQESCADGSYPYAGLVQATNGRFYGTTYQGGVAKFGNNYGTVFEITAGGKLTTLYSFCAQPNCADGLYPYAGLMQSTNGILYGTTYGGNGTGTEGTLYFSLDAGLGPFVETRPTSGKVGATVIILGTNLKGTSSVTSNGTAATFTVVSNSEIKSTVPVRATTGLVEVTIPKKTLKSNVDFRVP